MGLNSAGPQIHKFFKKNIYPTLLKDLWLVEFPDVEVRPRGADFKVIRGFSQREESWCS